MRGLDIDPVNHLIYTVGAYWNRTYEFSYDPAKVAAGTGASSIVGKFVNEWRNMDGTNFACGHQQCGEAGRVGPAHSTGDQHLRHG